MEYTMEQDVEIPPNEEIEVELRDVQEVSVKDGQCLKWLFAACGDKYGDRLFSKLTPVALRPRNSFSQMLRGFGREVVMGESVDPGDLIGTRVIAVLTPMDDAGWQNVARITRPVT